MNMLNMPNSSIASVTAIACQRHAVRQSVGASPARGCSRVQTDDTRKRRTPSHRRVLEFRRTRGIGRVSSLLTGTGS